MLKFLLPSFVLFSVTAAAAHAAIDVASVVTEINASVTPIATVSAAVLVVLAGLKAWKLIRRAM